MAQQPSGNVTFLFTDIEGSTRLLGSWDRADTRRLLTRIAASAIFRLKWPEATCDTG